MNRRTVGVLGARGHVGTALLPLLAAHPSLRLAAVGSRALAGRAVADEIPDFPLPLVFEDLSTEEVGARALDGWVLALPNGEAAPYVAAIAAHRPDAVVVDLSADYRFDPAWAYGLVERNRAALARARRIANPGCYATGMQLAIAPLADLLDGAAYVFGVSGYSGAGTTPSPKNDPAALADNVMPYGLAAHLHQREVSHHTHKVRFLPHVAPFFRGITLTIALPLREPSTAEALRARVAAAWAGEPLVRVIHEIPLVRDAVGRHDVTLGGFAVGPDGHSAVMVATLDNLLKGAATQALQNLNLALGFAELAGIPA
ncbi:MAG: N-acetyl-gamma-glutamyl-phosphate reductase [Myxococcales bacterium]|nr:N-acetyl-gamma-glutamyl-phosphate reductase [Myxococcales bacterium]